MSTKFSVELNIQNGQANVGLSGLMDEDMDLSKIASINEEKLFIDFNDVTGINSCGIRDWITFLNELPDSISIVYINCPQVIIEQMNMVKGFVPEGAAIESFYAPFFCESCDNEEKVLMKPSDINEGKAPSDLKCSSCGAVGLEFDALPNQYFHFIK